MTFRSKRLESQHYGPECVGALRGSFTPYSLRSIRFFDPIGKAVEDFSKGMLGELWTLLQASLPESNVSVVIVLYMIGYTKELAKPTITFVSQDKRLRKQAFDLVKGSEIRQKYPGFEVANIPKISEFELFGQMTGSENDGRCIQGQVHSSTSLVVFTTRRGNLHGRRLMVYKETEKEQSPTIATAGGIVSYGGQYMFHTVNHILDELQLEKVACGRDNCGDESDEDDFEITGLSNYDEHDEEAEDFVDATSSGSMTPESAQSDVDLSESNFSSGDTPGLLESSNMTQCRSGNPANDISAVIEPQRPADEIIRAGEPVWASGQGDSLFLSIGTEVRSDPNLDDKSLKENAIPLENFFAYVEPGPRRAAVKVPTPNNGTIGGTLSATPSFIRLPGSKKFEEVYLARFSRPLAMGDCGSWVRDAVTDNLFGHIIAGSPKSGLVMIMPAHTVFRRVLGALSATSPRNLPSCIGDGPHVATAIKSNETDNLAYRAIGSNPPPHGQRIHSAPEAGGAKSNSSLASEEIPPNEPYDTWRTKLFALDNSREEDTFDFDSENEPYVVGLQSFGASEDVISLFMSALHESYPCQFQKEEVVGFCAGADMQGLEKISGSRKVSLLDDTNDEGCSSLHRGGLTAFDLYKALRRQRWAIKTAKSVEHSLDTNIPEVKGNIRRIYVANIDRWTVLSLAATASESQARVLGEFIYRHLQWTTGTRLHNRIITEGIPLYALEFHLPFYALRSHRKTLRDLRTRRTGEPLRQSQDITFLRTLLEKNDNSGNDIIYQAKVSCLVSGWDRYSWVAYMFIDLYFEESHVDEDLESIADYEQHLSDHGVKLDPFTAGETTSDVALREPREYFLQVLEVRLSKIKHEWEHLVLHIEEAIDTYMSDYWARFAQIESSSSRENPVDSAKGNATRTTLRLEFHEWMKMTTALLRELTRAIQEYSRELDLFFSKGVYYFRGFTHSTNVSGPAMVSLATIDRVRDELGRLSIKLQNFKDNLSKDIPREVTLRLAHESNEPTLSQQVARRDFRVLTWITFLSLPIALAAALLSTSQGNIPITPRPRNLLISILIIEGLIWFTLDALWELRWSRALAKWAWTQARKVVPGGRDREMKHAESIA